MTTLPSSYFVMQSLPVAEPAMVRVVTKLPIPTWLTGARITREIPEPMEYEVREDYPGTVQPFHDLRYPLMRLDLVEALAAAGVDNLQLYRAVLHDRNTGTSDAGFRAVNIVGAVMAADLERSVRSSMSDSNIIDASFDSLGISSEAAGGLLFFRLAESVNAVIAHARVRDIVEPRVPGIQFLEPSEWSG